MTLFSIKFQIYFFTSLQNLNQISQTQINTSTIYREVIHKNLHYVFYHIRKDCYHAMLESSRCIIKTEGNSSISKSTIGTYKHSLFLVTTMYGDLLETQIFIQIIEIWMFGQSLEHMVNKRERKVVFPSFFVPASNNFKTSFLTTSFI